MLRFASKKPGFFNFARLMVLTLVLLTRPGLVAAASLPDAGIKNIATMVSALTAQAITAPTPTITDGAGIKAKVNELLTGLADETQLLKITAEIEKNLPGTVDGTTATQIATNIKDAILLGLKSESDNTRAYAAMDKRIDGLESAKQAKMLSLYKDVDFLYEVVVGDVYDESMGGKLTADGNGVTKIDVDPNWYCSDGVTLTLDGKTSIKYEDLAPMTTHAKMAAVERTLKITPDPDDDLRTQVNRAYEESNNTEWQYDDIRFGVLSNYLEHGKITATSLAIHSYFAYRRFTPGKFTWKNIGRRFSGFLAVGTGTTAGKSEVKNPIVTAGLGFDLAKGFTLTAGWSVFSYKENTDDADFSTRDSFAAGITLNSDLWRKLFKND